MILTRKVNIISKKKTLTTNVFFSFFVCGAAGNRTLVQTRNPYAFYMLSFLLFFDYGPEKSTQAIAYPLDFSPFAKGGLRLTLY